MTPDELVDWLAKYNIPYSGLITNGDLPVYVYAHIDDSPAKLMATDSKVKLLFNQSWNAWCLNITGKLERVYDWNEIRERINKEVIDGEKIF